MKNNIYIATAADENYARGLLVMLASFLKTHADRKEIISIVILDGGLSDQTQSKIKKLPNEFNIKNKINFEFIVPDLSHLEHVPKLWGKSNLTLARLQIAELVPEADYIYWIDSDFIINKPLPNLDCLEGKMIAACIEPHLITLEQDFTELEYPFGSREDISKPYFNAGFMVINLKLWRQEKLGSIGTKAMCEHPKNFTWMDQSVINFFAADKISILDSSYNHNLHTMDSNIYLEKHWQNCNLHLTGELKPWAICRSQRRVFYQHLVFLILEEYFFERDNQLELSYLENIPKANFTEMIVGYMKLSVSFIFNRKSYRKKQSYYESKVECKKKIKSLREKLY